MVADCWLVLHAILNFFLKVFDLIIMHIDARQALLMHLENECRTYELQAAIFHEALLSCLPSEQSSINKGSIKEAAHIHLMSRPTERKSYNTIHILNIFYASKFIFFYDKDGKPLVA